MTPLHEKYPDAYRLMLGFYTDRSYYNSAPDCRPADNVLMAIQYALASQAAQPAEADGWVPIADAKPRHRYLGAFWNPISETWMHAGLGSVRDGVFRDALGEWPAVSRVFAVPPCSAATPKAPATDADGVERVRAQCKGVIGDLPDGRDPEEFCDTCYEDAVASLATPKAPATDAGEVEPAAWQWRHPRWTGGEWYITHNSLRDSRDAEYRPLYALATPPAPNDDLRAVLEGVRAWAASLTVTDMNEIVADNGITAGMVVGQEAAEQVRRIDRALKENRRG